MKLKFHAHQNAIECTDLNSCDSGTAPSSQTCEPIKENLGVALTGGVIGALNGALNSIKSAASNPLAWIGFAVLVLIIAGFATTIILKKRRKHVKKEGLKKVEYPYRSMHIGN